MAKYIINKGTHQRSVEAKKYDLSAGFFWFIDDQGQNVLTYKADAVTSITRDNDAK